MAGYILGEYGDFIANEPGSSPIEQFRALHSKFGACSLSTRALLLSTYIKFANLFPEIREEVMNDAICRAPAAVSVLPRRCFGPAPGSGRSFCPSLRRCFRPAPAAVR